MFEHYYFFFHYCMLSCRYVMFQKRILSKRKWGAQAVVMGARPPGLPVATVLIIPWLISWLNSMEYNVFRSVLNNLYAFELEFELKHLLELFYILEVRLTLIYFQNNKLIRDQIRSDDISDFMDRSTLKTRKYQVSIAERCFYFGICKKYLLCLYITL